MATTCELAKTFCLRQNPFSEGPWLFMMSALDIKIQGVSTALSVCPWGDILGLAGCHRLELVSSPLVQLGLEVKLVELLTRPEVRQQKGLLVPPLVQRAVWLFQALRLGKRLIAQAGGPGDAKQRMPFPPWLLLQHQQGYLDFIGQPSVLVFGFMDPFEKEGQLDFDLGVSQTVHLAVHCPPNEIAHIDLTVSAWCL